MDELLEFLEQLKPLLAYITVERTMITIVILLLLRNPYLIKAARRSIDAINQRFTEYLRQDAILRKQESSPYRRQHRKCCTP